MCANDYAFAARSASGSVVSWGLGLRFVAPKHGVTGNEKELSYDFVNFGLTMYVRYLYV